MRPPNERTLNLAPGWVRTGEDERRTCVTQKSSEGRDYADTQIWGHESTGSWKHDS